MYSYHSLGKIDSKEFNLWFNHHVRGLKLSYEEYAERVGEPLCTIIAVSDGSKAPTKNILNDMELDKHIGETPIYYVPRRPTIEDI